MTLKLAGAVVRGHPAILTVALLLCFAAQFGMASATVTPLARGILMAAPIGAMCLWWWATLLVARHGSQQPSSGSWDLLFTIPPLLALMAGLAAWPTDNSPAAFAIFASLFTVLTMAAKGLEKADAPDGNPSVGRMMATFLLMYLAPIGVWVLRSKIVRAAERSASMAPPRHQT